MKNVHKKVGAPNETISLLDYKAGVNIYCRQNGKKKDMKNI